VTKRNCEVTRKELGSGDLLPRPIQDYAVEERGPRFETKGPILFVQLNVGRKGTLRPCALVYDTLSKTAEEVISVVRRKDDLFYVEALQRTKYEPVGAKYLVVCFVFGLKEGINATFDYEDLYPGYEVICIVHRIDHGSVFGHYITSIKSDNRWYKYNDSPISRIRVRQPDDKVPPHMILLRRKGPG